tara:strand:+ start:1063 stop:1923 length:861 start_codon:yes stop_codon:yes gene_type:complete
MRYLSPHTINEAVAALADSDGDVKILAGGTDLLVQLRAGMKAPGLMLDVKRLPELRSINVEKNCFHIGAAVSGAEMGEHESLKGSWPGVVEAMELIGSTQIQGRATPGGNLCNASPAADSVPAMVAAGAICTVVGSEGSRDLAVEDVGISPGQTSLGRDEFVVDFRLPERPPHSGDAYLRFIPRTEMDIAVVGAGVNVVLGDDGVCVDARVSLGAVAPRVLLVPDAANELIGRKLNDEVLEKLDAACRAACRPIDDKRGTVEYRTQVSGVLARRAAVIAFERAGEK